MVYEYDPASNQWAKKRPMRLPSHHVAFATLNNKIYAFGGFTYPDSGAPAWNPVNNAWEYDPATDEWKELAPMPTKRGAAAAGVANGKIYVTGGANSLSGVTENGIHPARPHNVMATVEEYDPAANTWKTVRPLLLARNHHVAVGVADKLLCHRRPRRLGVHLRHQQQCRPGRNVRSRHRSMDAAGSHADRAQRHRRGRLQQPNPGGRRRRARTSASWRHSRRWKPTIPRSTAGRSCRRCRARAMGLRSAPSAIVFIP
jgi:hypothetical protein